MTRGLRENYILLLKIMALQCYHSIAQHHRCLARLLQTISGLRCLQSTDCVTKFNPWSFWRYFLLGKNRENSIWEFSHLYCLFSESVPWVTQRSYIWILHNNVFLHLFWTFFFIKMLGLASSSRNTPPLGLLDSVWTFVVVKHYKHLSLNIVSYFENLSTSGSPFWRWDLFPMIRLKKVKHF